MCGAEGIGGEPPLSTPHPLTAETSGSCHPSFDRHSSSLKGEKAVDKWADFFAPKTVCKCWLPSPGFTLEN